MLFKSTSRLLSNIPTMTNYNIKITSDIVCPWCYIGHARLSRAITNHKRQYPSDTFNLTYLPFYLNPPSQVSNPSEPAFPIPSRPRQEYYAAKFGAARATQIFSMLSSVASDEGLSFKFGGKTGPSRNGHRLVYYAQTHGGEAAQNSVMLALWRRYFEQEIDITTLETLVNIGVESGLGSKEEITAYLESGKDGVEVDCVAEEARDKGISGVPFYEIQERWEVSGAQEPAAFEQLFRRWKELEMKGKAEEKGKVAGGGDSCL